MKKILSITLVLTLVLSACSSGDSNKNEITMWTNSTHLFEGEEKVDEDGNTYRDEDTAVYLHAAERFEEETGIHVNFETIPAGNEQVDNLVKNEDSSVDIYATPPVMTDDEIIKYFSPAFTSVDDCMKSYSETSCKISAQSDSQIYAQTVSLGYDSMVIYNEDVLLAAGYDEVPTEMNEFMDMLAAIKDSGKSPVTIHRVENWPLGTFDNIANYAANEEDQLGKMLNYDEPFASENPYGISEDFMTQLVVEGYTEQETYADFGVAMDAIAYGDSAMMIFGSWVIPQIEGRIPEGSESSIKVAPFPKFEGDDKLNVSVHPDIAMYIPKGTDSPDEAQQFIDYLAKDPEVQASYGGIPALADNSGLEGATSEQMAYMDSLIQDGTVDQILVLNYAPNKLTSQEVLKDIGVYADFKYFGNVFDAASQNGESGAKSEIDTLNKDWTKAKDAGDYEYQDE